MLITLSHSRLQVTWNQRKLTIWLINCHIFLRCFRHSSSCVDVRKCRIQHEGFQLIHLLCMRWIDEIKGILNCELQVISLVRPSYTNPNVPVVFLYPKLNLYLATTFGSCENWIAWNNRKWVRLYWVLSDDVCLLHNAHFVVDRSLIVNQYLMYHVMYLFFFNWNNFLDWNVTCANPSAIK